MKIAGHPVHLMIIHFPSALFPLDFLGNVVGWITGDVQYVFLSSYGLAIGVAFGWMAALFGVLDLIDISSKPHAEAAHTKGFIHGSIQGSVLLGFTVLTFIQFKEFPEFSIPSTWILLIKFLLVTGMIAGNFLGGEIVLKMWHQIYGKDKV